MKATATALCFGVAAILGLTVGCAGGSGGEAGAPSLEAEVCQDAVDYVAACEGREASAFLGTCEGALEADALDVLSLECGQLVGGKADGDCPEFMARMGMCGGASATLGPWGMRYTRIVSTTSTCRRANRDLVEPGLALRNVGSAETCMETNEFRPVIDIGHEGTYRDAGVPYPSEERVAILSPYGLEDDAGVRVLGNVGHVDGAFTVARIPDTAFDSAEAFYLIESFEISGIQGSHGMVRVRFAAPVVELYEQYPASSTPVATTQDLILSVHAVTVRGGSYDPLGAGLNDGMALARGVYSIENKVKDVLIQREHNVDQYKLRMSGDDIRRYFSNYNLGAPDRLFTTSYHTFSRNCGTELLQVFADAFPERGYPPPATFDNTPLLEALGDALNGRMLPDIIPAKVRPALESRGLFDGVAEPWSTDPTVQSIVVELGGA